MVRAGGRVSYGGDLSFSSCGGVRVVVDLDLDLDQSGPGKNLGLLSFAERSSLQIAHRPSLPEVARQKPPEVQSYSMASEPPAATATNLTHEKFSDAEPERSRLVPSVLREGLDYQHGTIPEPVRSARLRGDGRLALARRR